MRIFLPSDKCNGGEGVNRPKSGLRRKRRQEVRAAQMKEIEKEIQERNDRALRMRVQ